MTTTLRFGDDERTEAHWAVHAADAWGALDDLDDWLRERVEYDDTIPDAARDAYATARAQLADIRRGRGIERE